MDILLFLLGLFFMFLGILGSFLPILPGPPLSWLGLLILYLTEAVPNDWWMLGITLFIALTVFILDFIIPAVGTKRFGGSKAGIVGTVVGLFVAIIFPVFGIFGIIIWPFVGALVGELLNKTSSENAVRAAFGSFIGFLTGTLLKFLLAIVYFGIFVSKVWEYSGAIFSL